MSQAPERTPPPNTGAQHPLRPKRRLRSCLKVGCAGVVLLVVLVVLAPQLVPTAWIRDLVIEQVETHTGRDCKLQDIEIGWIDGVTLRGLRIAGDGDAPPLLEADELSLEVDLQALLEKRLVIKRVWIQGAAIHIVRTPGGNGKGGFGVIGRQTHIRDASIHYRDPAQNIDTAWSIPRLTLTGSDINGPMQLFGTFAPQGDGPLGTITVEGELDVLENDRLAAEPTAAVQITLESFALPAVLAQLGIATEPQITAGTLDGSLDVTCKGRTFAMPKGEVTFAKVQLNAADRDRPLSLPGATLTCKATLEMDKDTLVLTEGSLALADLAADLACAGTISQLRSHPTGKLETELRADLAKTAAYLRSDGLLPALPEGLRGTLTLSGPFAFTPGSFDAVPEIHLTNLCLPVGALDPKRAATGSFHGTFAVKGDTQAVSGEGAISQSDLTLPVACLDAPFRLQALSGPMTFAASANETHAEFTCKDARLDVPKTPSTTTALEGLGLSGTLAFSAFAKGDLPGGLQADLSLAVPFADKPVAVHLKQSQPAPEAPRTTWRVQAEGLDLAKVGERFAIEPFASGAKLEGTASADSQGTLTRESIAAQVRLSCEELWAYRLIADCAETRLGITAVAVDATYGFADETIKIEKGQITTNALRASVAGTIGPGTGALSYNAVVRPGSAEPVLRALALPTGLLREITCRGRLSYDEKRFALQETSVDGTLQLDEPHALNARHDLTGSRQPDAALSIALQAVALQLAAGKTPRLRVTVSEGVWNAPTGRFRADLDGSTETVLLLLDRLSQTFPAMQEIATSLAPYRMAGAFTATAQLQAGERALTLRVDPIRLQEARLAGTDKTPIFRDPDTRGVYAMAYAPDTGRITIERSEIATSKVRVGDAGNLPALKLTYQGGLVPPAGESARARGDWQFAKDNRFTIDAPSLAHLRNIFPALFAQGHALAGAARGTLDLAGPLSALAFDAQLRLANSRLAVGSTPDAAIVDMPDTQARFAGRLNLLTEPPPAADGLTYPYMRDIDLQKGVFSLNALDYATLKLRDLRCEGELAGGVLTLSRLQLDMAGRMVGAARIDFNRPLPVAALGIRTQETGLSLRQLLGRISRYGHFQDGTLHLPVPSQKKAFELQWSGLTRERVLGSLSSNPTDFRVDDCVLAVPMDANMASSIIGLRLGGAIDAMFTRVLLRLFGVDYDKKTKKAKQPKTYRYERVDGRIVFREEQVRGAKKKRKASILRLLDSRVVGKNTADYRAQGYLILDKWYLNLRLYVKDHVERLIDVEDHVNRIGKLSEKQRATLTRGILRGLQKAADENELYYDLRGPIDQPDADVKQIQRVLARALREVIPQIGREVLKDKLKDELLDRIFGGGEEKKGGTKKGGEKGTEQKEGGGLEDLLEKLPF